MKKRTTALTASFAMAGAGVGIVLAVGLGGGAGIASAKPSSTITVQDQDNKDGAAVDTDGTVGSFKQATDGNASGPIEVATPQVHAGK